ncbi:alpha-xenorhabdolysin family binary toxin subunit B [Pseudomonas mucidolens]|uniref:Uncharacterized protein n=1 Tax=Pseudomonas mucidolens TaxID=46679 RepID=A0A1H2P1W1_9PSED|nr:alpha-xenorhabdolysin family binary toxin subunit B [Pseudomonas mucidolens]SDV11687.1 hypothetical protein SAMN05216202_5326 [Pseudomonas mucidolens]SQH36534.1 Uncharacterised protein [Pseudomonas mucidolens]
MSDSTVLLNAPNMMAVKDCREAIHYYAKIYLSDIDIESLRTDALALSRYVSEVDQDVNDLVLKVGSVMDVADVSSFLDDIQDMSSDPDALADYKKELVKLLEEKKKILTDLRQALDDATYNMDTMSFTSNTFRLKELAATKENIKLNAKNENVGVEYDWLLQKKHALDVAIEAYDSKSIYDMAKPLLDQVEHLANAALNGPAEFKKDLVKEGIEAAKFILKSADDGIKHNDMLQARIQMIQKLAERDKINNEYDQRLKDNFEETRRITAFEDLRKPKKEYLDEVKKIIAALDSFIEMVFADVKDKDKAQEIAGGFVTHAPELVTYSRNVYLKWLR